jgi:hypothetical protein
MDLDDVIPDPQYRLRQSRVIEAPPPVVWDELHRVTMAALPLGHALEGARVLPARLSGRKLQPLAGRTFLDVTPIPVVFSQRPQIVISAGLSQAWRLLGGLTPPQLAGPALRAWAQPGWIKAGMEFRLEPVAAGTLLSTETRVRATDAKTRRAFGAYWFVIRSSSRAIRSELLKVVARRAESSAAALHALITAGRRHRGAGEHDAAVRVFTDAHEQFPAEARPLVERGAILILQGRYDQALADYRAAGELDPHYPGLDSYFAELYLYTGRAAEALALSEDAAVREPDNLMHQINIAHAQLLLGRTELALIGYRQVAGQFHQVKQRFGRDLALQDLRLLVAADVEVPQLEQALRCLRPS